ncbi:hypothetical protein mvi_39 [Megavirus vitis]|nr:hypothetical protein mvi_39 [Megavirus vitis]
MKINNFINFDNLGILDYKSIIHCKLDDDYKIYESYEKNPLPNNNEILSLITKAKKSFILYKKIKDKYIKGIYDKNINPHDSMNLLIYLSTDKKFYCVNFNYSDDTINLDFMGIFEKKSGNFFSITHHFSCNESGTYLCLSNNKYGIVDYDSDYTSMFKENPLDIIVDLRNIFNETYENLYED